MDGKTFQDHRPLSIGTIIRNSEDLVIATMSKTLPMQYSVEEVEAIALENGVLLAQEMNLTNIIVESNKHSFQNQTGPNREVKLWKPGTKMKTDFLSLKKDRKSVV